MSVGDRLARGDASAAFSTQSGISDFENDLIFRPEIVAEKYGLTDEEILKYQQERITGAKMPDLPTVALRQQEQEDRQDAMKLGFVVTDRRLGSGAPVTAKKPKKFVEKQYQVLKPILDRVLVKRVGLDEGLELLEDGSVRDTRTGMIVMTAQYREHHNVGIVLAVGDFVVMGGVKTPLSDVVKVGDRVTYGDYNSEVFHMDESKVEKLCDAVEINYEPDPEGLRIVFVQDIRGIESPIVEGQ